MSKKQSPSSFFEISSKNGSRISLHGSHAQKADDKTNLQNSDFLKIQHQYSDHPKMKGEEPPKKPDGEGGTGKEEEDSEGPVAMDDDGDVDREEEEDELDDLTAEGESETHLR